METKKLTAKDLMIGDLVRFDISVSHDNPEGDGKWINCIVGGIGGLAFGGITRFIYLYDVKRKSKIGEFDFVRNVGELSYIPLTAEILEKNGFTRLGTSYILEGEHFRLDNPSNPNNYLDNYWLRISIKAVNIEYVHELQRALRFSKINKDIVL